MRSFGAFLRSFGSCPACLARRGAPLCADCRQASAATSLWGSTLGSSTPGSLELYFVGTYHAASRRRTRGLSPLGHSLRAFKDHGNRYAGRCLADLFASTCLAVMADIDMVVAIPSDPARLRKRGFHPAAWLARALSQKCGVPMASAVITRPSGRPAQRGLGGEDRRVNAAGAFVVGRTGLQGYSIALVDDVVTTGATLLDAARCIEAAGAGKVVCLALACADEDLVERCRSKTAPGGNSVTSAR